MYATFYIFFPQAYKGLGGNCWAQIIAIANSKHYKTTISYF